MEDWLAKMIDEMEKCINKSDITDKLSDIAIKHIPNKPHSEIKDPALTENINLVGGKLAYKTYIKIGLKLRWWD